MKKSGLAVLTGLAFGGAMIVHAPYAWSQAGQPGTGAAPPAGQKSGTESQVQKPTDPPMSSGRSSSGSRAEGTGMRSGTESRMSGSGHHWSKDKVTAIQEALKTKGFDPGTADGVVGPKTNQTLRDFQKSNNLQVTGRIDEKTASALGVDAGSMGSSSSSSMGKESTSGSRGSSGLSSGGTPGKESPSGSSPSGSTGTGQSSSSVEKEKTGSQTGSEPAKPGARGGPSTSPPGKPTGRE